MSTTIKHVENAIPPAESFVPRHVGPDERDVAEMMKFLGFPSLDALIDATVPRKIRMRHPLNIPKGVTELEVLTYFRALAAKNQVFRSFIGMGYSDTVTPPVIQRNILENPGWYTAYTPYQAEIAQGRLEALLNFQTMVMDLTAMEIANASLLDEATAAAEAMTMSYALKGKPGKEIFLVASECHPQTIDVVKTRASVRGIEVRVSSYADFNITSEVFGVLLQYPATDGAVFDYTKTVEKAHANDALVTVAADILSLVLLAPPGEWGADIVVGNTQRFGVPLGYGGPHAAYFATRDEFKRHIPGRIIGVSRDADGKPALRMALQTREQHIRREKATSNVCTAQVLLAVVASMYAVYHGPQGLTRIARRVHGYAAALAEGLRKLGFNTVHDDYFDTIRVAVGKRNAQAIIDESQSRRINLRFMDDRSICIALDETVNSDDIANLLSAFNGGKVADFGVDDLALNADARYDERFNRTTSFLTHPVFNKHHAETEMLRYMNKLQSRDLSLVHSMIPLGSCTMKLNATAEMMPITWPGFAKIHPFAPLDQTDGYRYLFDELESALADITGFAGVSLQPNAGSQGELAGLLVIHAYHASRNESHRNICLIPQSAHGTNPASAVMAGMRVVVVKTDEKGNIDVADLRAKAEEHGLNLAALMVTYPSTHGVFEESIVEICDIVHKYGGQVYMDGANMNAMVGLCRPSDIGADVCH
ncbi:MAG TPA: aminomethyl-transferring glycine dehydrogenase, partial [Gemmatimonadaceae bacterium]|nr:aminomethyl-transferring glycine dehydrogenase [Gemmatimonadaceae bacterium]